MERYQVLKQFRDIHTKEIYTPTTEIEMTAERAEEVTQNLDDSFLVRIENEEDKAGADEEIQAVKDKLKSLGVSFHPNTGLEKLRIRLEEEKAKKEHKE